MTHLLDPSLVQNTGSENMFSTTITQDQTTQGKPALVVISPVFWDTLNNYDTDLIVRNSLPFSSSFRRIMIASKPNRFGRNAEVKQVDNTACGTMAIDGRWAGTARVKPGQTKIKGTWKDQLPSGHSSTLSLFLPITL